MYGRSIKRLLCCSILILILSLSSSPIFAGTANYYSEDITAYCSNGTATSSGSMPWQGVCAMHVDPEAGGLLEPMLPYGAIISLNSPIPMYGGGTRSTFVVMDVGDFAHNHSNNFLDIWQGTGAKNSAVWNWCINNFGTLKRDYSAQW